MTQTYNKEIREEFLKSIDKATTRELKLIDIILSDTISRSELKNWLEGRKKTQHEEGCYFLQDGSYLMRHCNCGLYIYNSAISDLTDRFNLK